jgi:type I restriction enzyme R subunit
LESVLRRYELRQLSAAEVVQRLVEIARNMREIGRRHEQLGLSSEEAAFYDALAGGANSVTADPKLAAIARDLVESIREDLTIDWADRESTEAAIRRKIRRLLRQHEYEPPTQSASTEGSDEPRDLNHYTQLVLEQAKALYRYWPEVQDRLFE